MDGAAFIPSQSRLVVAAMLNRIMASGPGDFLRQDAEALWQALPAGPAGDETQAGPWLLRRRRRFLHRVIEVERAAPETLPAWTARVTVGRLRYTLFGMPLDLQRRSGPRLALPVWPGFLLCLDLAPWRPWKRAAA